MTEIQKQQSLLGILQQLLGSNPHTSRAVLEVLISSFLTKVRDLNGTDRSYSLELLRIFKLIFGAVSVFGGENEALFAPHLSYLITSTLQAALETKVCH